MNRIKKIIKDEAEVVREVNFHFGKIEKAVRTGKSEPELVRFDVRLEGADAAVWRALVQLCNDGNFSAVAKSILSMGARIAFNKIFADAYQKFLNGKLK